MYKLLLSVLCLLSCSFFSPIHAQSYSFKDQRAEENYLSLKDSVNLTGLAALKYIALSANRNSYLSIGGSYRPRFEHFSNSNWIAGNDLNYYSQRLSFHTDWHFGKYLRFFGELYHGYKTQGATFLQSDDLDWHQGFVEILLPFEDQRLSVRFGRQEMKLGAGRLIDLRVGTNIRRSFDLGKVTFQNNRMTLDAFYGKEVQIDFDAFDNEFGFFDDAVATPKTWGVYSQIAVFKNDDVDDSNDLYYIGFRSDQSAFSDVVGKETRHSIGIRRFGNIGHKFQYNTEFVYQFGDIDGISIRAFNLETDWKYTLLHKKWKPTIGLKLDWSSGDQEVGDDRLNTFNPLFVNPSIYSLAAVNTPVNLISFHPSFIFFPTNKWMVNIEFATFFRASDQDGLYTPPRFQTRPAGGITDNHIGNTVGIFTKYTYNRYINFDIRSSYFIAGDFVEASGASEGIFQVASTLNLLF
ncbi:MAG: alginate export family protein [Bacteroidota bacterium]